jgi:mono/diheme cytochrome c family protein
MHRYLRRATRKILPVVMLTALLLTADIFVEKSFAQAPDGAQLFQVCSACHTIGKGKLIGPDLKGVTQRKDRAWLLKFIHNSQAVIQSGDPYAVKLFEDHNKVPMPPFTYTDEQINAILDYIDNYNPQQAAQAVATTPAETPTIDGKPYVFMAETKHPWHNFRLTLLVSLALVIISLSDLFITRIIKAKFIHVIIILISVSVMTEIMVLEAMGLGRQQYYEPDQPIAFSHYIHANQNQIDCKYCHYTVMESRYAGIPGPQLCMNCHMVVRQGKYTGTAEIDKIYKAIETGKSIEWVKVHNLPKHVAFNHSQHVAVGKVDCKDCHGDVANMDRIQQVSSLGMGWCIQCHRTRAVQFKENHFYAKYPVLQEELNSGQKEFITVEEIGGTNCSKCHY